MCGKCFKICEDHSFSVQMRTAYTFTQSKYPCNVWENVSEISGCDCEFGAIKTQFTDGMCV